MSKYANGAAFERKIKKAFEDAGYFVIRSAGSKGKVDLCAIRTDSFAMIPDVCLIQCKRGSISIDEWNELVDLAETICATAVLAAPKSLMEITGQRSKGIKILPAKPFVLKGAA